MLQGVLKNTKKDLKFSCLPPTIITPFYFSSLFVEQKYFHDIQTTLKTGFFIKNKYKD